ncbi:MAG: cyclic nucleotide-binding domain-containing protein [Gammaproteobacteria bacterium]|nr:MAG: cyclic nucleotide-binding domain-containing protein [Gammaproteobacteria bacterium]UTW42273.1 cyclic nucleotide-binding domain-containing protein [bacterium SCSIO 12844]
MQNIEVINLTFTIFLTLAYIFAMVSFLFKNALTLRVIFVVSSVCSIIAGLSLDLYLVAAGNFLILIINITLISVMYLENRPVKLNKELLALHQHVFHLFSPNQLYKLSQYWHYKTFKNGDILISDDDRSNEIYLVINGTCDVVKDKRIVASIGKYQFVGEMQWLTGSQAIATVKAIEEVKCICLKISDIEHLKDKNTDLYTLLYTIVSEKLVIKVKNMNLNVINN